jgi:hypothetical protein
MARSTADLIQPTIQLAARRPTAKAAKAICLTLGLLAVVSTAGCTGSQTAEKPADQGGKMTEPAATEPAATETAQSPAAETSSRPVENLQLAPATDPMTMVLTTRQPSTEATGAEQIRLSYPSSNKAVVTVTKTGLADDSVAATRTRYEFAPVEAAEGPKQWQLTQATEQNKCQPERGSQEWTGELCQ